MTNGTFDRILIAATEHAAREAGLPGRADREAVPCADCASAIPRPSMEWRGSCGVPIVRYGCAGDPDACGGRLVIDWEGLLRLHELIHDRIGAERQLVER